MALPLDELAEALHATNGSPCPRRVTASVELRQQFGLPITPTRWQALEQQLSIPLPPLERQPGRLWAFPNGWTTILDLAGYLAEQRPAGRVPAGCTPADWQEAQVFAGVRACLVESGNLDAEEVVRSARLMADLGLE
jgi:hypothetical protein